MASELVRQLIDAGIHFGHRASRWNPKMAPYIFGKRNTIHIIDIRETVKGLLRAKKFIARVVAGGDDILLVGTKRQARLLIRESAERVSMPYVVDRWLGGTLTNFQTIRSRVSRLEELEVAETDGTALEYSKKMIATRARELRKIRRNLEGIRNMNRLPGALFIIDVHREKNAVREAKKLGIPTVCLIDTDSDPAFADVPIPGNDDAMRAIGVILEHVVEAIELGKKARKAPKPEPTEADPDTAPRRRASRSAAASSGESPSAPTGGEVPDAAPVAVAQAEPKPVVSESAAPATTTEPAP
ncbi:MAG: 30S ribosomal protein S2 [Planctomycetes bacterium]|nr:30S ribosomal protein S2 [Planctomycetota bacterium]